MALLAGELVFVGHAVQAVPSVLYVPAAQATVHAAVCWVDALPAALAGGVEDLPAAQSKHAPTVVSALVVFSNLPAGHTWRA